MTLDSAPRVALLMLSAARTAGLPADGSGQTAAGVPRFEIASSPIELTGPVRPGEYLGVTGPRSAWLGLETGEAELWIHPLKVGSRFRLGFSTPAYGAPIPGSAVARTVHVRPEVTTIAYSHAAFQVRQHRRTGGGCDDVSVDLGWGYGCKAPLKLRE